MYIIWYIEYIENTRIMVNTNTTVLADTMNIILYDNIYALESLTDVKGDLKFWKTISFTFCTLFVKYPRVSHLKSNLFIVSYNLSSELNVTRSSQIPPNKIILK